MIPTLIYLLIRVLKKFKLSQKGSISIDIEPDIEDSITDAVDSYANIYPLHS